MTKPDLTTRGTPRVNARPRKLKDLPDPTLSRNHDINSTDHHFQSKVDESIAEKFNKFCHASKRTKKDITTQALQEFLNKHDPSIK